MAIDFRPANSAVYTDSPPVTSAPFTMSCWFKFLQWQNTNEVMSLGDKDSSGLEHWLLRFFGGALSAPGDESVEFRVSDLTTAVASSPVITADYNVWVHLAVVETSAVNHRAFINGVGGTPSTSNKSPDNTDRFTIGNSYGFNQKCYGAVAEAGLWNVALSSSDINDLAKGKRPSAFPGGLVAYLKLGDDFWDEISQNYYNSNGSPVVHNDDPPMIDDSFVSKTHLGISI